MTPNKFGIIRQNGASSGAESNLYAVNFDAAGLGFSQIFSRNPQIIKPSSYEANKRFQENATTRIVSAVSGTSCIAATYDVRGFGEVLIPVCAIGVSDSALPIVSAAVDRNGKALKSIMLKIKSGDGTMELDTAYAFFKTGGASKLLVTHAGVGLMTEENIAEYILNNPVIAFKYH